MSFSPLLKTRSSSMATLRRREGVKLEEICGVSRLQTPLGEADFALKQAVAQHAAAVPRALAGTGSGGASRPHALHLHDG